MNLEPPKLFWTDKKLEAGCDEAGRGCLAGPVVAAAVILPKRFDAGSVNDSKKLNAQQREEAAKLIKKKAIAWAVAVVENEEIDRINILKASFLAMHKAVEQLKKRPDVLLIDGHIFYAYPNIPHICIIEGDAKVASISAASILAKTHRDKLMIDLHERHPQYNWKNNKGYATQQHQQAILEFGITDYHRRTFAPVSNYLQAQLFEEEVIV